MSRAAESSNDVHAGRSSPDEMPGNSGEVLANAGKLLAKLNQNYPARDDHSVQKRQLRALIKLLKDPLFQDVYRANLEVEKAEADKRKAALSEPYAEEDAIIRVHRSASRTLELQPHQLQTSASSVDPEVRARRLNAAVDTEKGFVRAGESIEEFVDREKGPERRCHKAHFYREPKTSLGFSVAKVRKRESSGAKMVVDNVIKGGIAEAQGIRRGDDILVVNKVLIKEEEDYDEALEILKNTGSIDIILAQDTKEMVLVTTQDQIHRIVLDKNVNGLGFGIVDQNGKILIEKLIPNTPAAMHGNLKFGDEFVEFLGKSVENYSIDDILMELKNYNGDKVELKVKREVFIDEKIFAEGEIYHVSIEKDENGMGITVNSPFDKESTLPISVKGVSTGSAAGRLGKIESNDEIIVVNGQSVHEKTSDEALTKLKSAGEVVHLTLVRSKNEDFDELSQLLLTEEKENAIREKWCTKLEFIHEMIIDEVKRKNRNGGWGFNLEGVDMENSNGEVSTRHFIKAIAEEGPIDECCMYKEGDELLELIWADGNYIVYKSSHAEVVKCLSSMPDKVIFVAARNSSTLNIAVIEEETVDVPATTNTVHSSRTEPPQQFLEEREQIPEHDDVSEDTVTEIPVPVQSFSWFPDIIRASIVKVPHKGLGLSLVEHISSSGDKHIIIDNIVSGSPASQCAEVGINDKLVQVNGENVVGRKLEYIVSKVGQFPYGAINFGIRKYKHTIEGLDYDVEDDDDATSQLEEETNIAPARTASQCSASITTSKCSTPTNTLPPNEEHEVVKKAKAATNLALEPPAKEEPRSHSWRSEALTSLSIRERSAQWERSNQNSDAGDYTTSPVSSKNVNVIPKDDSKKLPVSLEQKIAVSKMHVGVVGLSIAKEPSGNGVLVKSTLPGGAINRDGRIEVGDIVTAINDVNIKGSDINDVRGMLRELGRKEDDVFITYITREDAQYYWTYQSVPGSLTVKPCLYFEGMDNPDGFGIPTSPPTENELKSGYLLTKSTDIVTEATTTPIDNQPIYKPGNPFKNEKSKQSSLSAPRDKNGIAVINHAPEHDSFIFGPKRLVEVVRHDGQPLGLSILGHEMGIFIKDIVLGSPAAGHRDSQSSEDVLNPGDRLLSVNGENLMNCNQKDAVLIIKGARSPLRFIAQSCTIRSEENETLFSSVN